MNPPATHHPPPAVVARYGSTSLDAATAVSVELHLQHCEECRAMVNATVDPARLDANWDLVLAELDAPRRGVVERSMVRLGMPVETTRLLVATPSMRRSWFLAIGAALFFGITAAAPNRPEGTILLFLALAPLIPVVGVALAYGPGVDPAYEITLTAPISGFRLVLLRAAAVLGTTVGLAGAASLLLLPRETPMVAAWLVPALGLSATCLALSTFVAPRTAGLAVGGAWLATVLVVASNAEDQLLVFGPVGQVVLAAVGVAAAIVVVARRRSFEVATRGVVA